MWCPRTMVGPGDLWVPRLLPGEAGRFDLVGATRKVATYGDCSQEAYEWRTWTGMEGICVMYIRIPIQGVH
jgi:hypothetical protein